MSSVLTFGLASHILKGLENEKSIHDTIRVCNEAGSVFDLFDDLKSQSENLEVVILGSGFNEPIQMAQRIYALDKTISILILASSSDLLRIQKAIQFSLFINQQVVCVSEEGLDVILKEVSAAISRTRTQRRYSKVIRDMNSSLLRSTQPFEQVSISLDKLLDYAPIGVAIVSLDSRIIAWNRRAKELTELAERDALFQSMDSLFQSKSKKSFHETLAKAKIDGGTISLEATKYVAGNLKTFDFKIGILPETSNNSLMAVFHDITDRKHAEAAVLIAKQQAEAANESKSRFLANMSHEIRTPIGAILGFLDLMRQHNTTPTDVQEFIATIDRNGHQLLRLIDDILDISKIEAGRVEIAKSKFSLIELLADIQSLMGFRAREKSLHLKMEFASKLPEFLEGDSLRIRQVLVNIVGNAIKFTEHGHVNMEIKYHEDLLSILIDDTGIGLSEEQSQMLFQPFMQADPSITRRFGGTGLGLALSQKLAILMKGNLRLVRSAPGVGSSFEFTLKIPAAFESKFVGIDSLLQNASLPLAASNKKTNVLRNMKILLVEDSPDNQVLISRYLAAEGAYIELANDGLEGIAKALSSKFDVIVMDMQMPRCDGLEATKRLRQQGYDRPIVALTAHAMEEERRKAFAAGCTDYLTKPIDRVRLTSVLSRYRMT